MMGFILILLIFGGLAVVFRILSKACSAAGQYLREKSEDTEYHQKYLQQSLSHIEQAIVPEVERVSYTQRLIEANKAVQEKKKLTKAMAEELGILD